MAATLGVNNVAQVFRPANISRPKGLRYVFFFLYSQLLLYNKKRMRVIIVTLLCMAVLLATGVAVAQERPEGLPPDEPYPPVPPSYQPGLAPGAGEEELGMEEPFLEPELPGIETPGMEMPGVEVGNKIAIDAVVVISYKFSDSAEPSYTIKYHMNMGGEIKQSFGQSVGMIKGNAKIATDISGFLAKSPAFECLLRVSIADIPYEIVFKRINETEADISVSFKGQLLEDWESLCTFIDGSNAKFNTRGAPERVVAIALEKAKPPLNKIETRLEPERETSMRFYISKFTIEDEKLGTIDASGTGVVTIQPLMKKVVE